MGVYKPKRRDKDTGELRETPYWHFEFVISGRRFYGSTGQKGKRAAEAFEDRKRQEVADGTYDKKEDDPADMTFDEAAGIYWADIGKRRRSRDGIETELAVLVALLGAKTRIGSIKTATVRAMMAERRKGLVEHTEPDPSPTTMNRLLERLRATLNHVAEEREAALPKIAWKRLMEPEPDPPERTFSIEELNAWCAELGELERFFLIVKLTYGPRLGELFVPPSSIVLTNAARPLMKIGKYFGRKERDVRKDGTLLDVVLLPEHAVLLGFLADRARKARLKHIWAEIDPDDPHNRLRPVNYYTMRKRLLAGAKRAGIEPGRLIHSLRHHAATAIVGDSGDIGLAKKALGHSSIVTTQRYAHASDAKLLEALARISRTGPELPTLGMSQPPVITGEIMVPPPGLEPGIERRERNKKPE